MIIQMKTGIAPNHSSVQTVVAQAQAFGLNPKVSAQQGQTYGVTEVYLYDGKVSSATCPTHMFRSLPEVESVRRVTPPRISLSSNGVESRHQIKLGGDLAIGNGHECLAVVGPCTIDRHIGKIVRSLAELGVQAIRGGAWKPRSGPYSFPGYGAPAVRWILEAARDTNMKAVFIEVMESPHIEVIQQAKQEVGYRGSIVLWVGARTMNSILLAELGKQQEFPVMIKNGLDAKGVDDFASRAEWILAGEQSWDGNGKPERNGDLNPGNDKLILCLRGLRQQDRKSIWRFSPNWDWTETIRKEFWTPICIDPSHAAGTMRDDLVLRSLEQSLVHRPHLVMVEGGYPAHGFDDGFRGLCDVDQSVPIERIPEVLKLVAEHNQRRKL